MGTACCGCRMQCLQVGGCGETGVMGVMLGGVGRVWGEGGGGWDAVGGKRVRMQDVVLEGEG